MMKKALTTAFLVMAFITFSYAQDITGNWKGLANGQFEINYTFKVDGEKLTGSSKGPDGSDSPIKDGVIKGNDLSFTIDIMGGPTKVTGKINGDVITLSFKVQDNDVSLDLKKVK